MSSFSLLFLTLIILASASQTHQYCHSDRSLENGFVGVDEYHMLYIFSCEDGYTLEGQSSVSCHSYDWERQKPKCIKFTENHQFCLSIEPPEHGFVNINEHSRRYEFFCEGGYTLQGKSFVPCNANNLEKLLPKCIKRTETRTRRVCENPPPLENGAIECDAGDLTPGKACRFSCSEGYKLQGASVRNCMGNYEWSGKVKCIRLADQYYSSLADENRRIHQGNDILHSHYMPRNNIPSSEITNNHPCQLLSCEQLCLRIKNRYECKCCPGYILNKSDKRTCMLNIPKNINMTGCLYKHGKVGDVELQPCLEGYIFDYDRKTCIGKSHQQPHTSSWSEHSESCSKRNGGCQHECLIDSNTIKCACRSGFELHVDGKHCIDTNECSMNNFGCSHSCVNVVGSAYCTCPRGFRLDWDQKTCIDIDECLQENRCQHFCNNTQGSYFCTCKPSYILIEGYKCEGCKRNSFWSYEKNACVDCPKNSHTDSEGKTSIKDCRCDSGYTGNPGEYITCEDIDECSTDNFGCTHECVNIPGGAYCICPKGFMLDIDNRTCIDIDECSIKNGGCEGLCLNKEGGFDCICPDGFRSSKRDRYSCDDIDECFENNGGCEHLCINYRGGFYCACNPGYQLDSSLKNCSDIKCPRLPLPRYSYMECTHKNKSLSEKDTYPVGTKCSFKCHKGFKLSQDDNKLKCKRDGTWKGILPECKPESCPPVKVPENGKVHPSSCSKYGATVKEKCTFSCHAGYILEGAPVYSCRNNLTWSNGTIPICKLVKVQPVIKCPEDIQVILSPGEATQNITIPEPIANTDYYEIRPSWVVINEPIEFPVGMTQVIFTAISDFNETSQCEMSITVLDEEPPVFHSCPDPITIEEAKASGEFVTWDDPVVTDNVELVSVFSILKPNITLTPGTYFVEYVARDTSGNIGTCSFTININRVNCSDLRDPIHGKANCMDWMFGKLCNPECDDGYMRYPEDPLYFSCDDTGVWEPNDFISECLQYTLAASSVCQDGFELKKVDVTGEEVCIECPSTTIWSSAARKCEK